MGSTWVFIPLAIVCLFVLQKRGSALGLVGCLSRVRFIAWLLPERDFEHMANAANKVFVGVVRNCDIVPSSLQQHEINTTCLNKHVLQKCFRGSQQVFTRSPNFW